MANKFKCRDCRHSFSLNAGSEMVCPKCKSDNIEPVKGSSFVWKLLLFVVMAVVGYFTTDIIVVKPQKPVVNQVVAGETVTGNVVPGVAVSNEQVAVIQAAAATELEAVPAPLEPINTEFNVYGKSLTEGGFTISVAALADYEAEVLCYELYLNENDEKPFLESNNGTFKSSEYRAANGKYYVKAFYEDGNYTLPKLIDGIVKPAKDEPKQVAKMGQDELQSKIDKSFKNRGDRKWYASVAKGGDKRLADKVSVKNTTNGKTYSSIAAMFADCWMSATKINVEEVAYDEATGCLNAITINIVKK